MKGIVLKWGVVVTLACVGLVFSVAGATVCYTEYNFKCCAWSNPAPNSDRWCGSTFCPDQPTSNPDFYVLTVSTQSFARKKDPNGGHDCTCVFKVYVCSGGVCTYSGQINTGQAIGGERIDLQQPCPSGPGS